MGLLTKEEKLYIDPETGKSKWVTTKKGLIRERKSRTPSYDSLRSQMKAKQKGISKKKWDKRKKTAIRVSKGINRALDWVEGKPPKKQTQHTTPRKKKYIVRDGMAYPVYQQKKKKTPKKPSKKSTNPFDIKIHW